MTSPEDPSMQSEPTYLSEAEQQLFGEMANMVASHEVRLEKLEEREAEPKTPRDWITRHQDIPAWEELATWVDWLNANYSMPDTRRIPACWPAHPGLVHVLAGLRAAWQGSVLADEQSKEQGNAMAAFHDYHLFPFFHRLTDPTVFMCGSGHRADVEHAPTDRSLFPEGLIDPGTVDTETGEIDDPPPEEPPSEDSEEQS